MKHEDETKLILFKICLNEMINIIKPTQFTYTEI